MCIRDRNNNTQKIVGLGLFTAIVIVLQLMGSFIRFGTFSISLVLVPVVIGAALYGAGAGAWLGFVFGVVVLLSGDAAALCASVKNVFEQVLPDEQRARIEDIKRALLASGAECAAMTGSGSAVFGLFREENACRAACGALRSAELQTFCTIFV